MSDHEEGYHGPAVVVVDESEVDVMVVLRGYFEPIDGHYHWYGRVGVNEELSALLDGRPKLAVLRTSYGEAAGQLSDPDTWGRYRIAGTSRPPFAVATTLAVEVAHD
jgi:hypothetical protein